MSLNLEKQLCFYGAYHQNRVNVAIHMICVPAILLTSFLLLSNTPSIALPSYLTVPNLPPNLATLATAGYCMFYILLEPIAGSLITPILLGCTAYFNSLTTTTPSPTNEIAASIFIFSWAAQILGHGVFEGRAPALLDNLVQALALAPFFVWMEILFKLGYRPELKGRVDRAVAKETEKFRNSKGKNPLKNGKVQ